MSLKWTILGKMISYQTRILLYSNKNLYKILAKTSVIETNINKQPIKRILSLTNRIAEVLPWEPSCLCKVMVVRSMLYKYQIKSKVYLSVRKNKASIDPHAWMEIEGIKYLSPSKDSDYATLKTIN